MLYCVLFVGLLRFSQRSVAWLPLAADGVGALGYLATSLLLGLAASAGHVFHRLPLTGGTDDDVPTSTSDSILSIVTPLLVAEAVVVLHDFISCAAVAVRAVRRYGSAAGTPKASCGDSFTPTHDDAMPTRANDNHDNSIADLSDNELLYDADVPGDLLDGTDGFMGEADGQYLEGQQYLPLGCTGGLDSGLLPLQRRVSPAFCVLGRGCSGRRAGAGGTTRG